MCFNKGSIMEPIIASGSSGCVSVFVEHVCGHTYVDTAQCTEEETDLGNQVVSVLPCIKHEHLSKLCSINSC